MRGDRTETVCTRVTKREARIMEQAAKADDKTLSEYVRVAVLTVAVLDGNAEALKVFAGYALNRLVKVVEGKVPSVEQAVA